MTKKLAMILATCGLGAGSATAEPVTVYGSTAPSATVSYADLNLDSPKGVERLQNRVRAAASDICLEPTKEDLKISMARSKCYRAAVHDGFGKIDGLVSERLAGKASISMAIVISAR